jgi:subfamily B ATP-binding cassette protein MsbA
MRQLMRLLRYLRPYRLYFYPSILLLAITGLVDGFHALLLGPVLDRVLRPESRTESIALFRVIGTNYTVDLQQFVPSHLHNVWTVVAFALVTSALIKGVCDYVGTYLVNYAGFGLITDLRNDLHKAMLRRSAGFFQRMPTGILLSTSVADTERIQLALSGVLAEFLQNLFAFMALVGVVIVVGRKFSVILVLFLPFILLSSRKIGKKVRHTTRGGQDKLAEIQNILHETISGIRIVKAFGMELWEIVRFRAATRRLFKANLRSVRAAALASPLMQIFGAVAVALLLWLGRDQIKNGYFSAGSFIAFLFAVFRLYDPMRKFTQFNNSFQQALGASSSVFAVMDETDEVREKAGAVRLPRFKESIRFEHVSFSYGTNGETREVLRDLDLEVRRGEVIAIVGSSGAGKSTLVHLLPRFFDVSTGRLLIDGHDVRDVTLASLRAQIGIVTQETILFNDSLRNNIAYGQPEVSQEQVEAAARAANAHEFIMATPDGYDTAIGERGLRISGGERQRIAIARALLKNAPILILDEATSALDNESELLVQAALQNLIAGRTVFVIAHRLSTVRHADRILVLENGVIADAGSHDELMNRLGTYRRLYELQFMDADAANGKANGGEENGEAAKVEVAGSNE